MSNSKSAFKVVSVALVAIGAACGGSEAPPPASPATAAPSTSVSTSTAPSPVVAAVTPAASVAPSAAPSAAPDPAPSSAPSVAAPTASAPGDIVGTVTLPGGKPGRWSVVYLEDAPKEPGKLESAYMDNQSMQFLPPTVVITTGGKVTFHNNDPFPHNIFSMSPKFDLGLIPKGAAKSHTFEAPGASTVLCNLHPAMVGYVVVIPSTVYAQADDKGKFRIKAAPGGSWHLNAWAPRMKSTSQAVTVNGAEVNVTVTMVKE